jgi:ribosome maturation factor RimP
MTDSLEQAVQACVTELGFDLEALELTSGGKKRLLRVAIDADDGVGIDDITDATRALSVVLDADDALMGPAPYTLEVTSRGVDRPLTEPRHWRRNAGRKVRARMGDDTVVEGRIGDSDDAGVDLVTKAATRRIDYADVESAVIQAELTKPPAPGKDG